MNPGHVLLRFGQGLLLAVPGALTGLALAVLHTTGWGLALGVLATATTWVALGAWHPMARIGFTVGWWVPVGRGALPKAEGDYLLAADLWGYLLLGVGFLLALATLVVLPVPQRRVRT